MVAAGLAAAVVLAHCGRPEPEGRRSAPKVSFGVELNRTRTFELPPEFAAGAGYVTGIDGARPEISTRPVIKSVELHNPGPGDVVVSAIHLNDRSMILTDAAFDATYPLQTRSQLETVERLFWDVYGTYSHGPAVATNHSLQRLLRGTGTGRCTETNGAFVAALARQGIPAHSAWAVGHALYDVVLDGRRRSVDLNMRRYTRDHRGEVVGADELWTTPQLSLLQASDGGLGDPEARFRYAVITHTVQPDTREITYDVLPDTVPLGLEPGDGVVFDLEPVRSRHIDNAEAVARGSMAWVRHGWLHLRARPELVERSLTIARHLPFPVDRVVFEATVSGAHSALVVTGATDAGPIEIAYVGAGERRRVRIERDLDVTDRLQLSLQRTAVAATQVCRVEDVRVSIRFMYNARLLLDWRMSNTLRISGEGGPLEARLSFDPDAHNPWREDDCRGTVRRDGDRLQIAVDSDRPATHFEYFLSPSTRALPVSPAFYWVDTSGHRTAAFDTLPVGRIALHSRCRAEGGYWSPWHRAPAEVEVAPPVAVELAYAVRDGRITVTALDGAGRPADRAVELRVGRNRFLSPRDDIGFPSVDPSGLVAEIVAESPFPFDVLTIPPGGVTELPPWAAFAVVRVDGRLASELVDVRAALRERGIDPDPIRSGTTFALEHEVVSWPLEFYRIAEVTRSD
jgi:hypothetical protein